VTDDGAGNLIDPDSGVNRGTINYTTGAVSVTFANAITANEQITSEYNPVQEAIPQAILFFQDQFTLRPVPDRGYTVELVAYRTPSQALLGSGTTTNMAGVPELLEWWETLAFGAAKKVYEDRNDMEGVQMMQMSLAQRFADNETRTYAQIGKQSIGTIYTNQLHGNSSSYFGDVGGSS
jgi:hypothetical protein